MQCSSQPSTAASYDTNVYKGRQSSHGCTLQPVGGSLNLGKVDLIYQITRHDEGEYDWTRHTRRATPASPQHDLQQLVQRDFPVLGDMGYTRDHRRHILSRLDTLKVYQQVDHELQFDVLLIAEGRRLAATANLD